MDFFPLKIKNILIVGVVFVDKIKEYLHMDNM